MCEVANSILPLGFWPVTWCSLSEVAAGDLCIIGAHFSLVSLHLWLSVCSVVLLSLPLFHTPSDSDSHMLYLLEWVF